MDRADVDPDLERQLDAAQDDEPVEAVLLLHADDQARPPIDVAELIGRAGGHDGEAELSYLPRIGALVIRARSQVIRLLISQPEVEMASANRLHGDIDL
jgi:hypothetical protein